LAALRVQEITIYHMLNIYGGSASVIVMLRAVDA
jgi:hypothetical protein